MVQRVFAESAEVELAVQQGATVRAAHVAYAALSSLSGKYYLASIHAHGHVVDGID